jgi:predicted RecB family nuclease
MKVLERITAHEVISYFECRTKAELISQAVSSSEADVVLDLLQDYQRAARSYVERATGRTLIDFKQLTDVRPIRDLQYAIDCASTFFHRDQIDTHLAEAYCRSSRVLNSSISPIFFCPFDRVQPWSRTVLVFAALAIERFTGSTPAICYICFGQPPILKTVRLNWPNQHLAMLREFANARSAGQLSSVTLNAHCSICQYRARCLRTATDEDGLSLVSSIPEKERRKLQSKGITTITQLSYTYRPRRKRRPHATPRLVNSLVIRKNDHRLKALAIRKKQVHILHAEPAAVAGTPVYFDVEGIPGWDTYYLAGMRFNSGTDWIERSFWTDTRMEERDVWAQCLRVLSSIDNPYLVHYGSYESRFLVRMKERYPDTIKDLDHFDRMVDGSRNLLKTMYASIYFPTFTNGLKEIAGYLGFTWSDPVWSKNWTSVRSCSWCDVASSRKRLSRDNGVAKRVALASSISRSQRRCQTGRIEPWACDYAAS